MNKEELENEAEVCMHNALFWLKLPISKENVEKGGSYILKLLEPREKQIEIDAKQIRALQKQNGELTDKVKELEVRCNELFLQTCEQVEKVKELEAQIEKMKCCGNCKHFDRLYNRCELTRFTLKSCLCNSLDKWEIKENE